MARILPIDDDDDLTHFLRGELERRGYTVDCLEQAEPALELLRTARPPGSAPGTGDPARSGPPSEPWWARPFSAF